MASVVVESRPPLRRMTALRGDAMECRSYAESAGELPASSIIVRWGSGRNGEVAVGAERGETAHPRIDVRLIFARGVAARHEGEPGLDQRTRSCRGRRTRLRA